jgi:hypothetical protein
MMNGVWTYSLGREDIKPTINGITIKPDFGLDLEANFQAIGAGMAMLMAEIPVLATEMNDVISRGLAGGLQLTAVHNHRVEMTPQVWWIHLGGMGVATQLATAVKNALPKGGSAFANKAETGPTSLPVKKVHAILGGQAQVSSDTSASFSVDRNDAIFMDGMQVLPDMGVNHRLYMQPIGGGRAAAEGELVLETQEVQGVVKTIRQWGISITALHNHMTTEVPRLFFLHTWAVGNPLQIARAHRAALNLTNTERPSGSTSTTASGQGLG